jgi:hypothetical protein
MPVKLGQLVSKDQLVHLALRDSKDLRVNLGPLELRGNQGHPVHQVLQALKDQREI